MLEQDLGYSLSARVETPAAGDPELRLYTVARQPLAKSYPRPGRTASDTPWRRPLLAALRATPSSGSASPSPGSLVVIQDWESALRSRGPNRTV